jgi:SAM-dependent methyltransferase
MWTVIVDRVIQGGCRRVLEIGCGSGQLASFLIDEGIDDYRGIDFSPAAIEQAVSKELPRAKFEVADALTSEIYKQYSYDVLICTEVLEHVEADLDIVARFAPEKRTLCTVPNFPYTSHVRHFRNEAEVAERYGEFFQGFSVRTFRRPDSPNGKYFLFEGVSCGR